MNDGLLFVLISLASFRLTRLITADTIFKGPRDKLQDRLEARKERKTGIQTINIWQSKLAYLVGCSWCSGVWVSAVMVALTDLFTSVPLPVLMWAAASAVVGLLAAFEPND